MLFSRIWKQTADTFKGLLNIVSITDMSFNHTRSRQYYRSYRVPPARLLIRGPRCKRKSLKELGSETPSCHFACLSVHAEARVCVRVCVRASARSFPLNKQVLKALRLPQLKSVPITISGTWGPKSLLACLTESTTGLDDTPSQQRHIY